MRETLKEVGVTAKATKLLGAWVHPATGRTMIYLACDLIDGQAHVADTDEIAEVTWAEHQHLPTYVPHGIFPPVQGHLDATLLR